MKSLVRPREETALVITAYSNGDRLKHKMIHNHKGDNRVEGRGANSAGRWETIFFPASQTNEKKKGVKGSARPTGKLVKKRKKGTDEGGESRQLGNREKADTKKQFSSDLLRGGWQLSRGTRGRLLH